MLESCSDSRIGREAALLCKQLKDLTMAQLVDSTSTFTERSANMEGGLKLYSCNTRSGSAYGSVPNSRVVRPPDRPRSPRNSRPHDRRAEEGPPPLNAMAFSRRTPEQPIIIHEYLGTTHQSHEAMVVAIVGAAVNPVTR